MPGRSRDGWGRETALSRGARARRGARGERVLQAGGVKRAGVKGAGGWLAALAAVLVAMLAKGVLAEGVLASGMGRQARRRVAAWLLACCALSPFGLLGCGSSASRAQAPLGPPQHSTTLGPGDVFTLRIVGENDLPDEFQVASDGTVDFPYIHRVDVSGLEPQELARRIRDELVAARILTDPSVIVSVKEYRSKNVTVLGKVRKAGSFPLSTGMTLLQAISQAGGLSATANTERVNLTRRDRDGVSRTVILSFDAIAEGRVPDVPLQAGDQIYVNERVF